MVKITVFVMIKETCVIKAFYPQLGERSIVFESAYVQQAVRFLFKISMFMQTKKCIVKVVKVS